MLVSTLFVAAACAPAAVSPTPGAPSASAPATASAPASPSASAPASASASAPEDEFESLLFDYEYSPEAGTPGGSVVVSDWQAANQLNPFYSNAFANSQVFAATMRGLWVTTADGHWKPDLAAKMPKFSDGSVRVTDTAPPCPEVPVPAASGSAAASSPAATETATEAATTAPAGGAFEVDVELLPGLKWSDGEDLTLNDWKYTWDWVLDPDQTGIVTLGYDKISDIEVSDDGLKATFKFCENYAGFYGLLGTAFLPEHYMSGIPVSEANATSYPLSADIANSPVSGPFKYVTASADTIELERNDDWAGPAEACDGPCLDTLTYRFFPDNKEGMIAAFLAGEIDVATDLLQGDYDAIAGVSPEVGQALLDAAWEYEHLDMNQAGLGRGKGHPALQDLNVRKAIAMTIDRQALWETVFPGQPFPSDEPICTNAPPGLYWRLEDATCPETDVEGAKALLESNGYTDSDGDGIREKDGVPLDLVHCTSQVPARELSAQYLAGALKEVGINLEVNTVDSTTVFFTNWPDVAPDTKCNLAHGNYDTAEFAYVLTFDLFGDYYYSYHTEQIPTDANEGNGYNYLRYSNPEMDDALNTLASAIQPADQVQAAYTIQQLYTEQIPEIVLYYRASTRGVSAGLHNFNKNPSTSSDMWNVEDWWVET
ncbi:MAG TPA: peptide ABC transporter substrate-binding protein [Candidatus Limnocylindrales bacterium]|nr:peptide ABC transporter substrate-binding protein [Candidatus Limnocylindrales bacterium]